MDDPLAALWQRALAEDQLAWQQLYNAMQPRLCALLRTKGASEHDIEDLIQASWLRAFENSHKFNPQKGSFGNWMFVIATRLLFNKWRKSGRNPPLDPLPDEGLPGCGPFPEDDLLALERIEQLDHCLDQLDSLSRTIISLRFWEGLQFKAIEKELRQTRGVIDHAFRHGTRKLLKCMELLENKEKMKNSTRERPPAGYS